MQVDGTLEKGESHKAQDIFRQVSEALEGTYASLKSLAQTAATVHRSREEPQHYHWQAKSQTEFVISSKRFPNF